MQLSHLLLDDPTSNFKLIQFTLKKKKKKNSGMILHISNRKFAFQKKS